MREVSSNEGFRGVTLATAAAAKFIKLKLVRESFGGVSPSAR